MTRIPKSALRFTTDTQGNQVVKQGNRQMIVHQGKPPRRFHWLLYTGVGMAVATLLFALGSWGVSTWQQNSLNAEYGMPRTYQTNAVVGHADSAQHPTHFIFENLDGRVIIIELPGGSIAHAHIYGGPSIYTANGNLVPVTGSFQDVNGDGKPDMVVTIGEGSSQTQIIFLNNGTLFVPEQ
jgi:hypothetical protein